MAEPSDSDRKPRTTSQMAARISKNLQRESNLAAGKLPVAARGALLAGYGGPHLPPSKNTVRACEIIRGGPQMLNKISPRIVAETRAQNLGHIPGCCFKFRQSPTFGHEIVANKWAQNPDRVVCKTRKGRATNLDSDWAMPGRGKQPKALLWEALFDPVSTMRQRLPASFPPGDACAAPARDPASG